MIKYYREKVHDIYEIKECENALHSSRKHFHKELAIALIEAGSTTVEFSKSSYRFEAGQLIIIAPYLVHQCNPIDLSNWKFTMLYINMDWIANFDEINIKQNSLRVYQLTDSELQEIRNILGFLQTNNIFALKEKVLKAFLRKLLHTELESSSCVSLASTKRDKLFKIKQFIEENYEKKINLQELAEQAELSKYYLLRLFRENYNLSPALYQRNIKFNKAKQELKRNKDLARIAVRLGYYDQSHFTNEFLKFSGITPALYRKNC